MNRVERVLSVIDVINEQVGRLTAYVAVFMVLSVVYEVIARYLFNSPTIWSMEINQYLLCGYTALAGGYALVYRSHVNVDILHQRFGVRTRAFLDILTSLFFFLFIIVLIWKSGAMAWEAWEYNEHSETLLEAPLFPAKVVIPLGGLLILLQGLGKLIRDVRVLITGIEEAPRAAGDYQRERKEK
jgi:TRAP-type mannitol/chloroaromatic compound transport system permease small subunit